MQSIADQLTKLFGVSFSKQDDIRSLRQFHAPNAYCLDEHDHLIGLCACEGVKGSIELSAELFDQLQYLNLSDNEGLKQLTFKGDWSSLKHLDLSDCKLPQLTLPEKLDQLEWLDVSRNELSTWPKPKAQLPNLIHFDLSDNNIQNFSALWLDYLPQLDRLYLKGNPLPDSKRSAVEKQANCIGFYRDFYAALKTHDSEINKEFKVLLVGNGGVGKTCLVNQLVHGEFEPNTESTHGISLEQYPKEGTEDDFPYLLNLWDFAGQDRYHATHRLFLQPNAIYLLLWDEEGDKKLETEVNVGNQMRPYKNYKLAYWMDYIKARAGKCPLIIVKTKTKTKEDDQRKEHPERATLNEKYSTEFLSFEFVHIDSKTGYNFEDLKFFIQKAIRKMNREEEIPKNWIALRDELRNLWKKEKKKTISLDLYADIASNLEVEDPIKRLVDWLVPAGVVFYKKDYFFNEIILDQNWAIEAIYTILNRAADHNRIIENSGGKFTGQFLANIWSKKGYSPIEQQLFVQFMLDCELCFERSSSNTVDFEDRVFFAPQLMSENPPEGNLKIFRHSLKKSDLYYIRYRHKFLHYGIIQRFIVRTHKLADEEFSIWQNGTVLRDKESIALIKVEDKDIIKVEVNVEGISLMNKVRNLLEELQGDNVEIAVSNNDENYVPLEDLQSCSSTHILDENRTQIPVGSLAVFKERKSEEQFEIAKVQGDEALLRQYKKKEFEQINSKPVSQVDYIDWTSDKLKLLFLSANPPNTPKLTGIVEEHSRISKCFSERGIPLPMEDKINWDKMVGAIVKYRPDIIHFSGHGYEQKVDRYGTLKTGGIELFSENMDQSSRCSAEDLFEFIDTLKERQKQLKLIFFNACYTNEIARIVSQHDLYAVGMNGAIIDDAARKFSPSFYNELIKGDNTSIGEAIWIANMSVQQIDRDVKKMVECYYRGERIV